MWTTTGPWDMKRTWRSYVIPGVSMTRPAAEADGAQPSTKMPAMRALRSTTAAHGSGMKDEPEPVLHVSNMVQHRSDPARCAASPDCGGWASDLRDGR